MEERLRMSDLLNLYGNLLTDKQRDIMELYFNDDISLTEISEHTGTSRQAIFDIIRRCEKLLLNYDEKLNLLYRQKDLSNSERKILDEIDIIESLVKDIRVLKSVENIKEILKEIF